MEKLYETNEELVRDMRKENWEYIIEDGYVELEIYKCRHCGHMLLDYDTQTMYTGGEYGSDGERYGGTPVTERKCPYCGGWDVRDITLWLDQGDDDYDWK